MTAITRERGPGQSTSEATASTSRDELLRFVGIGAALGAVAAVVRGGTGSPQTYKTVLRQDLISVHGLIHIVVGAVLMGAWYLWRDRITETRKVVVTPVGAHVRYAVEQPLLRVGRVTITGRALLILGALLVAILLPQLLTLQWQNVLNEQIAIFVLLALGLNVVVGLAGLLDLGYIAFFAIGAYTTAYLTGGLKVQPPFHLTPLLVIPFAILAAMLAGLILGTPTLRLRGDYLAIVTLGFGEIVRQVALNWQSVTNGSFGGHVPLPSLLGYHWQVVAELPFWYLYLPFIVAVIYLFYRVERSRVGRSWTAIREDEVAAQATGIPTVKFKLMAFAIGASTSGLAGVLWSTKIGFVDPSSFLLQYSILVLVFVIFGGMGSLTGVIAGTVVIQVLTQHFRNGPHPEDQYIYLGALMIIMMIFRPQGLIPSRRRAREFRMAELGMVEGDAMTAPTEAP